MYGLVYANHNISLPSSLRRLARHYVALAFLFGFYLSLSPFRFRTVILMSLDWFMCLKPFLNDPNPSRIHDAILEATFVDVGCQP